MASAFYDANVIVIQRMPMTGQTDAVVAEDN